MIAGGGQTMRITPGLEEIARYRESGLYKVVPISCELLADICTPVQAVRKLKNVSSHCFLLESAEAQENWGRYTFLGFDPKLSITCSNGEMRVGELTFAADHPSDVLRQILSEYKSPRIPGMPPFTGGLTGYFSYDYLIYSEPSVKRDTEDSEHFKDVDLMLFDKVIAFDLLADGQLSPVSAPWVFMKALRSGYLTSCGKEGEYLRLAVDDSYADDALHLDIWLGEGDLPVRAEILWQGSRVLSMEVGNFTFLQHFACPCIGYFEGFAV
jgi:hypothetical protein